MLLEGTDTRLGYDEHVGSYRRIDYENPWFVDPRRGFPSVTSIVSDRDLSDRDLRFVEARSGTPRKGSLE